LPEFVPWWLVIIPVNMDFSFYRFPLILAVWRL